MPLKTKDFDYVLPEELIATRPKDRRDESRMMVVDRQRGTIEHRQFRELGEYVEAGDEWVLNNTRVIPARVYSDDGRVELLCLERLGEREWRCLVKPGKRMREGRKVVVGGIEGEVVEVYENGDRRIEWEREVDLESHGHLALPHYMGREDEVMDRERYQTVYAREEGAIAAPTAGLHFTPEILAGLSHSFVTLHVGVGTFRPVNVEVVTEHQMHFEKYAIEKQAAEKINRAKRVMAVGTTVTRVLESVGLEGSGPRVAEQDQRGETDIFIYPPYEFKVVGGLLTNFHLPQSTLIMLVSAFAGRDLVMEAYRQAVQERYRFYSYGDCMLLI